MQSAKCKMLKFPVSEKQAIRRVVTSARANGTSENQKSVQIFPFDGKCSDFAQVRRFAEEKHSPNPEEKLHPQGLKARAVHSAVRSVNAKCKGQNAK